MYSLIICAVAFLQLVSSHHVPSESHPAPQKREQVDGKPDGNRIHSKNIGCSNQLGGLLNLSVLNSVTCGNGGATSIGTGAPFPGPPQGLPGPPQGFPGPPQGFPGPPQGFPAPDLAGQGFQQGLPVPDFQHGFPGPGFPSSSGQPGYIPFDTSSGGPDQFFAGANPCATCVSNGVFGSSAGMGGGNVPFSGPGVFGGMGSTGMGSMVAGSQNMAQSQVSQSQSGGGMMFAKNHSKEHKA